MTLITTSIIIAASVFVAYNAFALAFFGVPKSLSITYYLYKERWNIGWIFPVMMYTVVACMMPAWISLSEGSDFQFLAFLAPASIAFVGTAPRFKDSQLESRVHTVSAIIAAACSLLWVALVTPYWVLILGWFVCSAGFALITKTCKVSLVYWLEQVAFGSTFTAAILYSL